MVRKGFSPRFDPGGGLQGGTPAFQRDRLSGQLGQTVKTRLPSPLAKPMAGRSVAFGLRGFCARSALASGEESFL